MIEIMELKVERDAIVFATAERKVQVLHTLSGGALEEVVNHTL